MLMNTYGRFDVELVSGSGAVAVDAGGKRYIDFGSGIGVNALGYAPPGWVEAVSAQAAALQHTSNLYHQPVQAALARELCAAAGMSAVFLANSGAEANECAIKLARKYSFDKYGRGRHTILCLNQSFHGRTVTTVSATGQESFHQYFFPFTEGFAFVEPNDAAALYADGVCAVMLECVQGEGGVMPLDAAYLRAVRDWCTAHDVLLIADEVQTGGGRTGYFLACEHAGITPDVVTMAKGLGGGLPIGACLCVEALAGVLGAGTHGSTFGGNPVACAGARFMLRTLADPAFLADVRAKGERLRVAVAAMPHVKEVRGRGMMLGIVLEEDAPPALELAKRCAAGGLLILTAKTLLRMLPPLNIGEDDMAAGLEILQHVLEGI